MKHKTRHKKSSSSLFAITTGLISAVTLYVWIASNPTQPAQPKKRVEETKLASNSAKPLNPRQSPLEDDVQNTPVPAESDETAEGQSIFSESTFKILEDTSAPLSSVCSSLTKIDRKQNGPLKGEEIGKRFEDSVHGRSADPALASVQPIVRFVLTRPAFKGLFDRNLATAQQVHATERAFRKYRAIFSNRDQLEHVMNQSYLLHMLGRSVEINPDLAMDPNVMRYCNAIESELNDLRVTNFEDESKAFLEFLNAANIDPSAIGFNPNYKTSLNVEVNGDSLSFHMGWIHSLLAGS